MIYLLIAGKKFKYFILKNHIIIAGPFSAYNRMLTLVYLCYNLWSISLPKCLGLTQNNFFQQKALVVFKLTKQSNEKFPHRWHRQILYRLYPGSQQKSGEPQQLPRTSSSPLLNLSLSLLGPIFQTHRETRSASWKRVRRDDKQLYLLSCGSSVLWPWWAWGSQGDYCAFSIFKVR